MITRPDEYGHNNPDLAFVDSTFVRGGTRAVANLTALYALSSKVDQLAERITRVWVASEAKYYVLTNISSVGSSGGWTAEQTNSNLQQVTDNGATTTNVITAAGFTTAGNLTAGGIVSTNQFYAGATNFSNSIFVGWDTTAVYLGYRMGNVLIDIGTGVTNKVRLRNTGGFQIESFTGSGTRMLVADSNGGISVQSIPSVPVTSVFGRTGTITAQSGDYTTAQVTESGNLYYTDARARAAISFSAGSGAYNSTTGVITIPTDNNQIANSAGYITTISGITAGGELSGTYPNPTLVTSAVTGKLLTGVNVTGGSISASDSILSAFGKLQNQINGLLGGSIFQSTWNASTNSPSLASGVGTKGYYYIVSTAGSTNLDGITDWQVGDWAIFDGTVWRKVDNTDAVSSVNGFTGAVSLTTSNISEGSRLYYTDARARAALSAGTGISYNSTTGVITSTITQYTDSNARAALSFAAGSGAYNSTTGVITIPTNTNQLTNGAGYITSSALTPYALLNGASFTRPIYVSGQSGSHAVSVGGSGADYGSIGYNIDYTSTSNSYNYRVSDFSSFIRFQSGGFQFYTAASGTSGASLSPSLRYTLDVNGGNTWVGSGSFGGTVTATSFSGAGTGLTGTASSLSIGGNAATVTNGVYTSGSYSDPAWITSLAWSKISSAPAFITLTSLSAGAGISYNNTTGVITSTITQYTDANARAALSFTAGSGAYNSTTGVITIPTNNNQLTNGAGYITGNQTITISGDASGSGATSISLTLANSGVSAGTYTKVTVDAKGRVTSGTSLASGDVTGALGYTPYNSTNPSGYLSSVSLTSNVTGVLPVANGGTGQTTIAGIQSALGLGSNAYTSTAFLPLTGGTLVNSGSTPLILERTGSNGVYFGMKDGSGNVAYFGSDAGDFRIQTPSGGFTNKLLITNAGAATFSSSVTATGFFESSDIRKKTIIERYAGSGVDACKYIFNETGLYHYGYIAQEVEKVLPNAVTTREDGMKDVRYSEVHTFKIMLLENHIERLENRIKQLEGGI